MREEYDIEKLNPRKNPYSKRLKKQITINIDSSTIDYFKEQAEACGIPYQTLINLYLSDCVKNQKELQLSWLSSNENRLDAVEELSGSVPATMTLEEAREERLRKK